MKFKEFGTLVDEKPKEFKQFGEIVEQAPESTEKSLARTVSQIPQGRLEMTPLGILGELGRLAGTGESIQAYEELQENIPRLKKLFPNLPWENFNEEKFFDRQKFEEALQTATEYDPFTVSGLAKIAEKTTGAPLEPKTKLQKAVRFGSGASKFKTGDLAEQVKYGTKAAIGKEVLEAVGVPEPLAEIGGLIGGDIKVPKLRSEVKKLPSGLTEPKAFTAKKPQFGTLSKERQTATIDKLDKEAANLVKTSVEKHQPITKEIEKGFDFEGQFEKEFGQIQKLAEKANPEVDLNPVSKLMDETAKKYRGIPKLHVEAGKIVQEVKAFRNRPPVTLRNALKTYRSNNQKIRQIYETSRLTGKQQEYVDFLVDYNKAIADSFRETLPSDSAWIKMFEDANRNYKNFKDAKKTISQLKEVLGENPTLQKVERLADDVKKQKQLALSMGERGANEVIQIAKDLKIAKEAIKKIPLKETSKFDAVFPIYYFIPYIGKALGSVKALKAGRYAYGWFLSTPARQKAYHEALKALIDQDISSYKKATSLLLKDSEQKDQEGL